MVGAKDMFFEFKNAWETLSENERHLVFDLAEEYKEFLNKGKIERECVSEIISRAEDAGFRNVQEYIDGDWSMEAGAKIYANNRGKTVVLAVIGSDPIEKGMNIVGSHVDSPRLDLKPSPLYEDGELALLKTHYYGGIKKYQWSTIPLAIHGVVIRKDGEKLSVRIGEDEGDPVFVVTDILPHLGKAQSEKKMNEGITGEQLNVVFGSMPIASDEKEIKEKIKLQLLMHLKEKFGMDEDDFVSAELEVVPAGKPRDAGLDRSLILAYGHDDKVCAFPSLKGLFALNRPRRTAVAIFVDKEEIGSIGNTGMESAFFANTVAELLALQEENYSDLYLRRALSRSRVLSADVTAAFDPTFSEVFDKRNVCYAGRGLAIEKYSGSRGKSGGSDANAEFVADVRSIFNEKSVAWQTGELGRVDEGGGGTIAYILANMGADVIDCGVAVLSMHAPYELISKVDLYMAYKGYRAFLDS